MKRVSLLILSVASLGMIFTSCTSIRSDAMTGDRFDYAAVIKPAAMLPWD